MSLAILLGLMLVASVTTFHASPHVYVRVALAWTVAFLTFGQLAGLSLAEMGLANWSTGLLWGAGCVTVVGVALVAGVHIPRLHPLFADERAIKVSGTEVAVKSLVEVPLGTVLLEEVVFRSVLLGMLTVRFGTVAGVAGASFLFGLWHILPSLEMHDNHSLTSQLGSGWRGKLMTVVGTILATGAAGVVFSMLVVWSGCILAPVGLHWAMNSMGTVAAWFVARRSRPRAAEGRRAGAQVLDLPPRDVPPPGDPGGPAGQEPGATPRSA